VTDEDRATVAMLEAETHPVHLARCRGDEAAGVPAYDALPAWVLAMAPYERIRRCRCGAPIPAGLHGQRRFCSRACKPQTGAEARYRERNRERINAYHRAYQRGWRMRRRAE
jgi:hypothetical protein